MQALSAINNDTEVIWLKEKTDRLQGIYNSYNNNFEDPGSKFSTTHGIKRNTLARLGITISNLKMFTCLFFRRKSPSNQLKLE